MMISLPSSSVWPVSHVVSWVWLPFSSTSWGGAACAAAGTRAAASRKTVKSLGSIWGDSCGVGDVLADPRTPAGVGRLPTRVLRASSGHGAHHRLLPRRKHGAARRRRRARPVLGRRAAHGGARGGPGRGAPRARPLADRVHRHDRARDAAGAALDAPEPERAVRDRGPRRPRAPGSPRHRAGAPAGPVSPLGTVFAPMPVAFRLADPDQEFAAVRLASDLPLSDRERPFRRSGDEWVLE